MSSEPAHLTQIRMFGARWPDRASRGGAGSVPAGVFLAGHDRDRSVAVTAHKVAGGRFLWPVLLPPAQLPRPGQGDNRAQAAARRDPQAHVGQLRSQREDQGGARPHRDRRAGDHHAAQQPDHDSHVMTRPARPGKVAALRCHPPRAWRSHEPYPYRPPRAERAEPQQDRARRVAPGSGNPPGRPPVRPVSPGTDGLAMPTRRRAPAGSGRPGRPCRRRRASTPQRRRTAHSGIRNRRSGRQAGRRRGLLGRTRTG